MRDENYDFVDQGAVDDLINACIRLRPYLDAIVCYASTMDEHEPNKIVHDFNKALDEIRHEPRT
jgi:hypothetical protein